MCKTTRNFFDWLLLGSAVTLHPVSCIVNLFLRGDVEESIETAFAQGPEICAARLPTSVQD